MQRHERLTRWIRAAQRKLPFGMSKPFSHFRDVLLLAERAGSETAELIALRDYRLSQKEYQADVNALFARVINRVLKKRCDQLGNNLNFFRKQNDETAIAVELKRFYHEIGKLFFFLNYRVLPEAEKNRMAHSVARGIRNYLSCIGNDLSEGDSPNIRFEIGACSEKLKRYEQL